MLIIFTICSVLLTWQIIDQYDYGTNHIMKENKQKYFKSIIETNNASAYNNWIGKLFDIESQYIKALQGYNKAIQLNPKYADAYFNGAILLGDLGKNSKAFKDKNKSDLV